MGRKDAEYQAKVEQRRRERAEAAEAAKKAKNKKILNISLIALACVIVVGLAVWGVIAATDDGGNVFTTGGKDDVSHDIANSQADDDWKFSYDMTKHHFVELVVKDYGTIKLELAPEHAPITVDNFLKLVNNGFYNGITFHRIDQGFMIQGGDPSGNGTGGSGVNIKGEFSSNGVNNTLSHKRGVISMARSTPPNSASSQFFICDADSTFLDGDYAAFGWVVEGMDVVDKIAVCSTNVDGMGVIQVVSEQPVIESAKIVNE